MKKFLAIALFAFIFVVGVSAGSTQAATPLTGWAWSSNIGWISFNSTNHSGSVIYSVKIATTTPYAGTLDDYAWSSNIGWISFKLTDLNQSPACTNATVATVNLSTGSVTGWARATSGIGRTDGWDGCIRLSNSAVYPTQVSDGSKGVTYDTAGKKFKGFGWGSNVLGWIRFNNPLISGTDIQCAGGSCTTGVTPPSCSISASSITSGSTHDVTLQINIYNGTASKYRVYRGNSNIYEESSVNPGDHSFTTTDLGVATGIYNYKVKPGNLYTTILCSEDINVIDPTPPVTVTCVQPTRSLLCVSPSEFTNAPSGTPPTTVVGPQTSCPTSVAYCQYYCETGFKKNAAGTKCISSSLSEI